MGQIAPMLSSVDRAHRGVAANQVAELTLGYVSAYVVAAKLLTKAGCDGSGPAGPTAGRS